MLGIVANHLWQSTLVILAVTALCLALRNNGANVRYWLWMTASLKFFLPLSLLVAFGSRFAPHGTLPEIGAPFAPEWTAMANTVVQPVEQTATRSLADAGIANFSTPIGIDSILLLTWAIGFSAVTLFWLLRWLQVRRLVRQSTPLSVEVTHALPKFPLPIRVIHGQVEPGIVGIVQPILLIPAGLLERLNERQLRAIFAHERCHLERRDNLTAAFHMLVEAIFWFHPLVWWIGARLVEERENACDAAVLRDGNDPEVYAEGILDVCQHFVATPMDCVAGVSGADLKKRVRSIMQHRGEARVNFAKWILLASVAATVVTTPILIGALTPAPALAHVADGADAKGEWPAIDSVTVSLSQSNDLDNRSLLINPNGTFSSRNTTLRGVIAFAYGLQQTEVVEHSAHLNDIVSTRFDILTRVAKDAATGTVSTEQHFLAARRLLVEQFQLAFHWESERTPAYALTVVSPNAGLHVAAADDPGPRLGRDGVNSARGYAAPMILLKQFLATQLNRPIIDQTGLTGRYNFALRWDVEPKEPNLQIDLPVLRNPTTEQLKAAIREQLGLSLESVDGDVKRLVVDRVTLPIHLTPNPVEIKLSNTIFDRYVGHYEAPPNRTMKISRDGDRFLLQLIGQRPVQIFAESERHFFAKNVPVTATFETDANGAISSILLKQEGQELRATRMDENLARIREEELAQRIKANIAAPGTEDALRKYFASLDVDRPAYELMTPQVEKSVRIDWPQVKNRYVRNGRLLSVDFKKVSPTGGDIYLVTFENAQLEWSIALDANGKISQLNYRRLTT